MCYTNNFYFPGRVGPGFDLHVDVDTLATATATDRILDERKISTKNDKKLLKKTFRGFFSERCTRLLIARNSKNHFNMEAVAD